VPLQTGLYFNNTKMYSSTNQAIHGEQIKKTIYIND